MSDVADMNHAAVVTGYSPQGSADTKGGETVVLKGSGFTGATSVGFGSFAATYKVISDGEIQATAPAWSSSIVSNPATAKVVVFKDSLYSDGSQQAEWTWGGKTLADLQATIPPPPAPSDPVADMNHAAAVTGYSPQGSADTKGGETVVLKGSGFTGATSVGFGSFAATYKVISDGEIQATAPAWSSSIVSNPATAKVVVFKDSLYSDGSQQAEWTWGGKTLADLQATIPPPPTPSDPVADMNHAAAVTGYSPQGSADTKGGETVVIKGSGFTGATSVGFGSFAATYKVISDGEIQATAPAWSSSIVSNPATAKVVVFKDSLYSDGSQQAEWTWGGKTLADLQATIPPPPTPSDPVADMNHAAVVTGYSPQGSADTKGGETVVLKGSGFTGATSVGFGSFAATYKVISDGEIQATAPAWSSSIVSNPATAKVVVFKDSLYSDGSQQAEWTWGGKTLADLQATIPPPPAPSGPVADMNHAAVVTGYSPQGSADTKGGETVVLKGSGFTGATSVGFGSFAATYKVISDGEIQATAPAWSSSIVSNPATAKVVVFKDSLYSDGSQQAEWTWGGKTLADLQATI